MGDREYWPKFKDQVGYLIAQTIFVWLCGILFTRLATDTWVGPRPVIVGITVLSLVFLYMHLGYYLTLAMRLPLILASLYLVQVHLINPGDFLLSSEIELSWSHFLALWFAMTFSFLFRAEWFPFRGGSLHLQRTNSTTSQTSGKSPLSGKVVNLRLATTRR